VVLVPIKNIDNDGYVELYEHIGKVTLVQLYQKYFKYKFVLPIRKYSDPQKSFLDVGCARGDFLVFLKKNGFVKLYGLDVENALQPSIKSEVTFYRESIVDSALDIPPHSSVQIASVLHHLPCESLGIVADNLAKLVEKDGILYIYDVNRVSLLGRFFNNIFLRLFPRLFKSNEEERREQEALCEKWPEFVSRLENYFLPLKKSSHYIYVSFVGIRR
jgi:2-polyprenyl-3-methyl-5-hydroxy-6-metoxy-1,4-benzoquinol methylase